MNHWTDQIYVSMNAGQRQIAAVIESRLADHYVSQGGEHAQSVRTIEDVSFNNKLIDIKTRDINRKFSMPNLISVARLRKNKDKNIMYHFVDYEITKEIEELQEAKIEIRNQTILNIWDIDWSVLKIQNLGKGQLQLCGVTDYENIPMWKWTKEDWFDRLDNEIANFYRKQIKKFELMLKDLEDE